jgi:hypothetical protein
MKVSNKSINNIYRRDSHYYVIHINENKYLMISMIIKEHERVNFRWQKNQVLAIFHSSENTMHKVPTLAYILPYQACRDNLGDSCLQNLEAVA